jgi:hypothetical protein
VSELLGKEQLGCHREVVCGRDVSVTSWAPVCSLCVDAGVEMGVTNLYSVDKLEV